MTRFDLTKEYLAAVDSTTDADIEYLEKLGVPPEIASGLLPDYPVLGKARIQTFESDHSLQPASDGKIHFVCPCATGLCLGSVDVLDLAAWRPNAGGRIWLRMGVGAILNPDAQMTAYLAGEPLFVFSDVLSWLRGRCKGVVIVRWDKGLPLHLGSTTPLWCQTSDLASRIWDLYDADRPDIFCAEGIAA